MQERMTLSNMAAELGAQAGLIAPDEATVAFVQAAARFWPNTMVCPFMLLVPGQPSTSRQPLAPTS